MTCGAEQSNLATPSAALQYALLTFFLPRPPHVSMYCWYLEGGGAAKGANAPPNFFFLLRTVFCAAEFTYLLTPWCRVLLEKLTGLQLVRKFPAFHGTRRFITALTSVRHLPLSWASPNQSIYPHPNSWRSILILSNHLRLGLPSGLLPSGFPTKTLFTPLSSPIRATCLLVQTMCSI